jgi:predicted AlkP superfamily phosphohydrolase/phosphomutase
MTAHDVAALNGGDSTKPARAPRQLVIGLDSMEWDLVRTWSAVDKLPNLARLMREGTQAVLASVADCLPDQAWNCLCAGLNPAHFARYFYAQYDPATGSARYMPDASPGPRFFWDDLSDAGRRVAVIDVPHGAPSAQLNGFQLSWGTHAAQGPRFSVPASMLHEVDRRFGRHPVGECDSATSARARIALRSRLFEGIRMHGELFRHYAARPDWEVLLAVFGEPHCAGHIYWHDMDAQHPRHDPKDPHRFAGVIEEVYRAIDREVGAIIEAAGPGVRVYAVSAHGMGPLYHASWHLQDMLDDWGYGSISQPAPRNRRRRDGSVNFWRILRKVMPGRLQYAIYEALPRRAQNELVFRFYRNNRKWNRCRAFAVPNNDSVGAIRINLKGRDRNGIVEPTQYEQLRESICAAVAELRDSASGKPVVSFISRPQRDLRGPYKEHLPDITVRWDMSFPWSSVHSPKFGTLKLRDQDLRTGSHSAHGFLIAAGDGIPRGASISGASIYDIAPTIMHAAGVHPPSECEGSVLFALAEQMG